MMDEFEVCVNRYGVCTGMHNVFMLLLIQSDLPVVLQVNIQVPAPEQQSDKIAITGLANHLDRAKEGLLERVKELQAEQEDRVCIVLAFYNWYIQSSLYWGEVTGNLKCLWSLYDSHGAENYLWDYLKGHHHDNLEWGKSLIINFSHCNSC